MGNVKDVGFVMRALPHRFPFLLVDRVLEYEVDKSIVALKNVTVAEPHFPGHFPNNPVMPGVLQIEALAQASGLLLMISAGVESLSEEDYIFLAGVDGCRFRRPVAPGDQLMLHSTLTRQVRNVSRFAARVEVDGQTVCQAELTIAYKRDDKPGGGAGQ